MLVNKCPHYAGICAFDCLMTTLNRLKLVLPFSTTLLSQHKEWQLTKYQFVGKLLSNLGKIVSIIVQLGWNNWWNRLGQFLLVQTTRLILLAPSYHSEKKIFLKIAVFEYMHHKDWVQRFISGKCRWRHVSVTNFVLFDRGKRTHIHRDTH